MSDAELKPTAGTEKPTNVTVEINNTQPIAAAPEKPAKKKKTWQREVLEWVITAVVAVVIAFVVRSFIFEPVYVKGDSMYPTLHDGEIMYVSKTSYGTSFFGIPFTNIGTYFTVGGEPERFDVVVCNYPDRFDKRGVRENFVKRVVGLPGDTVEIKGGHLYVNGVKYEETALHEPMPADYVWPTVAFRAKFMDGAEGPYTVPEGHYLLMGDNRNHSNDSRAIAVGAVPRDMIVGHVEAVLWHPIPSSLEE